MKMKFILIVFALASLFSIHKIYNIISYKIGHNAGRVLGSEGKKIIIKVKNETKSDTSGETGSLR